MIRDRVRQGMRAMKTLAVPIDQRLLTQPAYKSFRDRALDTYRASPLAAISDRAVYLREYHESRVDESLALFDSFWGRNVTGDSYAIFLEMFNDPTLAHLRFVWVKNDGVTAPAWMYDDDRVEFVAHGSIDYARALLTAKYLVGNSNFKEYFIRKPEQIYVNPWHGTMLKKLGRDIDQPLRDSANTQRNFNQSSILALPSKWAINILVNAYGVLFGDHRAIEVGSPRVDLTLSADATEVRSRLGIPEGKKVLLYAPTWRGDIGNVSTDLTTQLRAIELMSKELGESYEVLVSLHNYVASRLGTLPDGPRVVPGDITINEVLAAVDVLVTDYSSIFFDYFVLDRPVVLYAYDRAEYTASRGLYMGLEELPVAVAEHRQELIDAIRAGQIPSSFETYPETMAKYLPREDGKASQRAVAAMMSADDESARGDTKTRLLMSADSLDPGPTSEALLALVDNLDAQKYHVTLIVNADDIDASVQRGLVLSRLPEWCEVVTRRGNIITATPGRRAFGHWSAGNATPEEKANLRPWLDLEARRIFGGTSFDIAINFSDSVFWTGLLAHVGARRCIAAINKSLVDAERYEESGAIDGVVAELEAYDEVAFFSEELLRRNKALMRSMTTRLETKVIQPVIDADFVARRAARSRDIPEQLLTKLLAGQAMDRDSKVLTYVAVGALTTDRHFDRLLHAFRIVNSQHPDALLVIVGSGPLEESLRDLARRLELAGSVIFADAIDNALPTINIADCTILGSDIELDWVIAQESMLLGADTICTDLLASADLADSRPVRAVDAASLASAMLEVTPKRHDLHRDVTQQRAASIANVEQLLTL